MKQAFCMIFLIAAFFARVTAQEGPIFTKDGVTIPATKPGAATLVELNKSDSIFTFNIAAATFQPGTKLDWHIHPGGQILLITEGTGYYQEKGKPKKAVHKGEVIKCLPGVEHWHGASLEDGVTYIATSPTQKGNTIWLQKVTDEEYYDKNPPAINSMTAEQEIIHLSKEKWQWMADKNVDTLAALFDKKAKFVHMGGSWGTDQELDIIKNGGIHYKKADIHEVSVEMIDNTAILLNRITLLAVVGGNEVTNPFMVTEVYVKKNGKWSLGSLSFTKLLSPDDRKH